MGGVVLTWVQIFDIVWKICVVITPVLMGACVLWLKSQFQTKGEASAERNRVDARFDTEKLRLETEIKRIDARGADHETRLQLQERNAQEPPSRHELAAKVERVLTTQAGLERAVGGMSDQLKTTNDYLHTLIERGLEK